MRRHAAMVYATCLRVTRDPHDAEDATQATFLTLAAKGRLVGEIKQTGPWLRKVAHRLSLDLIRSRKRRINRENKQAETTPLTHAAESFDNAHQTEANEVLHQELAKLPASYRMPLILHYFGGLSREEIADQLNLKPSTLGVRLHRARDQLRKRMAKRGIELHSAALAIMLGEAIRRGVSGAMVGAGAQSVAAHAAAGHAAIAPMLSASASAQLPITAANVSTTLQSVLSMTSTLRWKPVAMVAIALSTLGSGTYAARYLPQLIEQVIEQLDPMGKLKNLFSPTTLPTPMLMSSKPATWEPSPMVAEETPTSVGTPVLDVVRTLPQKRPTLAYQALPSRQSIAVSGAAPAPLPVYTYESRDAGGLAQFHTSYTSTRNDAPVERSAAPVQHEQAAFHAASVGESTAVEAVPVDATPIAAQPTVLLASSGGAGPGEVHAVAVASPVGGTSRSLGESNSSAGVTGPASASSSPSTAASTVSTGSRTETIAFAGNTANLGGFDSSSTAMTGLVDSRNTKLGSTTSTQAGPTLPGLDASETPVGTNAAKLVTFGLVGSSPSVELLDPFNPRADVNAFPAGNTLVGLFALVSDDSYAFDAADLMVRYDDLLVARLGLQEKNLKLWTSDGQTWTKLDYSKDIYSNLIWATAEGDFKFFAVSSPEPATLFGLLAVGGVLGQRRRRS